jgi:hypothetical protein
MIVDLRTYTMVPGRLKAFLELYEREGLPVQLIHQGAPIGYFVTEIGAIPWAHIVLPPAIGEAVPTQSQ